MARNQRKNLVKGVLLLGLSLAVIASMIVGISSFNSPAGYFGEVNDNYQCGDGHVCTQDTERCLADTNMGTGSESGCPEHYTCCEICPESNGFGCYDVWECNEDTKYTGELCFNSKVCCKK